jgi:hypothetical protein
MQPTLCCQLWTSAVLVESKGSLFKYHIQQGEYQVPTKMLFATVALSAGLSGTGVVHAADDATLNHCWGQVTKEFQAVGDPGLGDHASSHSPFTPDPGEGGRRGVGNVSKEDFGGDLTGANGDGAQGEHAIAVAPSGEFQSSLPEECQGTDMP